MDTMAGIEAVGRIVAIVSILSTARTETDVASRVEVCDNWGMAKDRATPAPLSDTLLRAIRESGLSVKALAKAAGVARMSIARFVAGERSLRLDKADRLAAYFGLELSVRKTRRREPSSGPNEVQQ